MDVKSLSELDIGGRETCISFSLCQIVMLCLKPKHDKAYTQTLIAQYLLSTWDKIWNYINETITTTRQEKISLNILRLQIFKKKSQC